MKPILTITVCIILFVISFIFPNRLSANCSGPMNDDEEVHLEAYGFSGWNRRQAITIDHNKVEGSSDLIDFPLLITLDHLNSEVIDGGSYSALNGGGDLRFSSDANGNDRLSIEVVEFVTSTSPANRRCQIWVKIPNLSTSTNTTIYVWYNKASESQPAASAPYGSNEVWSNNYVATWHMEEDPSAAGPQIFDSTINSNAGKAVGAMNSNDSKIAQIGYGIELDGTSQLFNVGHDASLNLTSNLTISAWYKPNTNSDGYIMAKRSETVNSGYNILQVGGGPTTYYNGSAWPDTGLIQNINQWNYVVLKFNQAGTGMIVFLNGAFSTELTVPQIPNGSAQNLYLGARSGNDFFFDGVLDELRVSSAYRSNDWILTEHSNQSSPSSFAAAGIPGNASSGSGGTGSGGSVWSADGANIYYNSGNVGIGITDPGTYKLAVNGKIHAKEVKVDLDGWADYVFAEEYQLPPLEEVKRHIREKGHLVNVPSATDVAKNGIELGEMNRVLLEKIEELTLYILEQDKEIKLLKTLEKRIAKLENKPK